MQAPRLDSLTTLRGFAALSIFAIHAGDLLPFSSDSLARAPINAGVTAVSFFFILSGFVLTYSRQASVNWDVKGYYVARIARVYPAFLVAWAFGVVVSALQDDAPRGPARILFGATLLQSWIPSEQWYFAINGVSWTLSCEIFFYACFPLLYTYLSRRSLPQLLLVLSAGLGTAIVSAVALSTEEELHPDSVLVWAALHLPITRLAEFVSGCVGAILLHRNVNVPLKPALSGALIAYCVAGWLFPAAPSLLLVTLIPYLAVIMALARRDASGSTGRGLQRRGLVWFGELSYCFYLVHQLVLRVWTRQFSEVTPALTILATLLLSTAVAALLHYLVELPLMKRFRLGISRRGAPGRWAPVER